MKAGAHRKGESPQLNLAEKLVVENVFLNHLTHKGGPSATFSAFLGSCTPHTNNQPSFSSFQEQSSHGSDSVTQRCDSFHFWKGQSGMQSTYGHIDTLRSG